MESVWPEVKETGEIVFPQAVAFPVVMFLPTHNQIVIIYCHSEHLRIKMKLFWFCVLNCVKVFQNVIF